MFVMVEIFRFLGYMSMRSVLCCFSFGNRFSVKEKFASFSVASKRSREKGKERREKNKSCLMLPAVNCLRQTRSVGFIALS